MQVTYRKATEADLPNLLPLLQSLFAIELDFTYSPDLQLRGLQMLLGVEQAAIIVALEQNNTIGMVTGQLTISTAEGGKSLLIEDLVVAQEYQRLGIGGNLLQEIAKWGSSQNASRMQLLADRTNLPALQFYTGNGWKKTQLIALRKYFTH